MMKLFGLIPLIAVGTAMISGFLGAAFVCWQLAIPRQSGEELSQLRFFGLVYFALIGVGLCGSLIAVCCGLRTRTRRCPGFEVIK
jgi:hypothetical protein